MPMFKTYNIYQRQVNPNYSLSFRTKRSGVRNLLASKGGDPSLTLGVTVILRMTKMLRVTVILRVEETLRVTEMLSLKDMLRSNVHH